MRSPNYLPDILSDASHCNRRQAAAAGYKGQGSVTDNHSVDPARVVKEEGHGENI